MLIMACVQGWLVIKELFGINKNEDNNANERINTK